MKKTIRLQLKSETLRNLDAEALRRAGGGYWRSVNVCWSDWCETYDCTKKPPCHPI